VLLGFEADDELESLLPELVDDELDFVLSLELVVDELDFVLSLELVEESELESELPDEVAPAELFPERESLR